MTESTSLLADIYCFEDAAIPTIENNMRAMYQYTISGDTDILMEGISDMVNSIVDSIRKLLDAIKRFFVNFFRMFTNAMLSFTEFCKKYKDELTSWTGSFKYTGYKFKVMQSKDPNMSSFQNLVNTYNDAVSDFGKLKMDDIKSESDSFLSDTHLEEIRADVLGVSGGIERDDFVKTVREHYRGSDETEEFEVDGSYVSTIVNHADDLVKMKKKAQADRDAIVNMLSRAEVFFSRKVGALYKGNTKYVDLKTFSADSSYKTSVGDPDNRETYSESAATKANALISLKYNETKAVASIINIVISERANALKDMVKQENQIVRKALARGDKKDDDKVEEATDYSIVAEELTYAFHPVVIDCTLKKLATEYQWLDEAAMTGAYNDVVVTEGVGDTVKKAIDFILRKFREASIKRMQDYSKWYTDEDVQKHIIESAKTHDMNLVPLWKGKYGSTQISNINAMLNAIKDVNINESNFAWGDKFVSVKSADAITQDKLKEKITTFFLVGDKDNENPPTETRVAGAALSSRVQDMFKYLSEYNTYVQPTSQIESTIKNIKVVNEAFGSDSFSELLGKYVSESDLSILMETGETGTGNNNSGVATAKQAVSDETKNGTDVTKPTENENSKLANAANNDKKDDTKKKSGSYRDKCFKFAQIVINAYITALEKRFVLYYNTINACADAEYKYSAWTSKHKNADDTNTTANNDTTPTENKK